jgi:cell division protein FtsB
MTTNRIRKKKSVYRQQARTVFGGEGTSIMLSSIIAAFFLVAAWLWYVPAEQDLAKLELEYAASKDRLQMALEAKQCLELKLEHLKNDPEYLEILSRDAVPWHKPNETIFTIER